MTLLALDGDGISREILDATLSVLEALDLGLAVDRDIVGFRSLDAHGTTLTDATKARARAADGIILGPVSHLDYPPVAQGGINPSGALRIGLDLYANIRPARSFPGVARPVAAPPDLVPLDLVIVRENTEGFYADRTMVAGTGEVMPTGDLALAFRKITRQGSRRIVERAFDLAAASGRKVTAVHKANVMRLSDGLFLEEARAVAARFPTVPYDEALVDAVAALLVRDPGRFGVIVTTNMFGDILSDLASELAGGLGLAASLNAGDDHAMAQAQHGSAPDIAGKDQANPTSLILSTAMLLDWLSTRHDQPALARGAARLREAVAAGLARPETRTGDIGGALGTRAYAEALIRHLTTEPAP
ncbi:MAG: isocitrate/isopropylmalate dehydrogenase family protein [Rhodobacterales bacterium]|nr:isocitrate/isopropylmalate dehydrogenase family protein [Rhodobacterales bacterium]